MNDMTSVIVPKSDQLNADDLIAGPRTIDITGVKITPGTEQPVAISFANDGGKPWKPCKSMSRVLVAMWGADAKAYVGRSLTLFRDPNVKWGGLPVGGIRISHMSDIAEQKTMALTETRGKRQPYVVKPLANAPRQTKTEDPATKWTAAYLAKLPELTDLSDFEKFVDGKAAKLEELRGARPDLAEKINLAVSQRRAQLSGEAPLFTDDEPEGKPDEARGEQPTLEEAKLAVDAAPSLAAVNRIVKSYEGDLSEEDQTRLSGHAMNVIAEKWPA